MKKALTDVKSFFENENYIEEVEDELEIEEIEQ